MRGKTPNQPTMFALVSLESRVPPDHPLRRLKPIVERVLQRLDPVFDTMYAEGGRPSIPPERLLKSAVLMALYGVRSERQFCEQLGYNMLFQWFLDMDLSERAFDHSTFSKNRQRLINQDVSRKFFDEVVVEARATGLVSGDHFSVDGMLVEAWASVKSFRRKDDDSGDNNQFGGFKGEKRSNETHESKTDPESRLFRKGRGREAKMSYMGHALMENRSGLMVDFEVTEATGKAERQAALDMIDRERKRRKKKRKLAKSSKKRNRKGRRITLAADKGYDTRDFVRDCRERGVTPHVAQNQHARRRSAIDARTTRHPGYRQSGRARLLIEKIFGWMKAAGGFRRSRFRGREKTRASGLLVAATFNLMRLSNSVAA
jgi:transposase